MKESNYSKYKALKNYFDFEYRDFNMGEVMASDIFSSVCNTKIIFFARESITLLVRKKDFSKINKCIDENISLNTHSITRKEHLDLVSSYIDKLNIKSKVVYLESMRSNRSLNVKHLFSSSKTVFKNSRLSFFKKIYFTILFSHHKILIDMLLSENIKSPKSYYAFNSSYGLETLLTLYFKSKGVNTYSLQHGIYFNFNEPIPINVINVENFTADKMLCWGRYTMDEMIKFGVDKKRLIQFGNPKYRKIVAYNKKSGMPKKCLVMLSVVDYNTGNERLFNLLKEIKDIEFHIKLHPSLDYEQYNKLAEKHTNMYVVEKNILLSDALNENYDFSISYNSTSHYDSLASGLISFGYNFKSDGGLLFRGFKELDELRDLMDLISYEDPKVINSEIREFVFYMLGVKDK